MSKHTELIGTALTLGIFGIAFFGPLGGIVTALLIIATGVMLNRWAGKPKPVEKDERPIQ